MKLTYLHWYKLEEPLWVDDAGDVSRRPTVFANLAGSGIGGGESRIRADFENGDRLREIFRSMDLAKPQWGSSELREAIGATYGVPAANVLTTTGASVAISIAFLAIREMFGAFASVLRCGWIIAHGEIQDAIRRSWALYFNSPCSLTEAAATRILRSFETYEPSRQRLAENRRIVKASFDALAADGLLGWTPPAYGCIAFPRITRAAQAADPAAWMEQFYGRLRDASRVSIVPGKWFLAPSHARVGFGGETHVVREGIARLEAAIRNTP